MNDVVIVLGSASDAKYVAEAGVTKLLSELTITHTVAVVSAHRNSPELHKYATEQVAEGTKVFIGVAGMAAALPGALAGSTGMMKPIIGVPLDDHGIDSCLYMPPGVPVLLTGVGKAGLKNAALAAAQILAVGDKKLTAVLQAYIDRTKKQPQYDLKLEEIA